MYVSSDESSEEQEEDEDKISKYINSEYESDNNGNSRVWSNSTSTVPDEISCGVDSGTNTVPDEKSCGVESHDSNGINHGSSTNNIELCNWDDSDCDCDAEDRYNEYKRKHQMEYPELYELKFKLEIHKCSQRYIDTCMLIQS